MSGQPPHAGPEETMEAEAPAVTAQAGAALTVDQRHADTRAFVFDHETVLKVLVEVGLVCVVGNIIYFKSRIRSYLEAAPNNPLLLGLEQRLNAFFQSLPGNHRLRDLAEKMDKNKIVWGFKTWADNIQDMYLSLRLHRTPELRDLVMYIAAQTDHSSSSSGRGGGSGGSSNPATDVDAAHLVEFDQNYFYHVPGTDYTEVGGLSFLPDSVKTYQMNGLHIMEDMYDNRWTDGFFRLGTLAHFARTGGKKQQGSVEAEQRFRDQMLMVEDPRGYVAELLDCIKHRQQQQAPPVLELTGLSLQVSAAEAKEALQAAGAAVQQAAEAEAAKAAAAAAAGAAASGQASAAAAAGAAYEEAGPAVVGMSYSSDSE